MLGLSKLYSVTVGQFGPQMRLYWQVFHSSCRFTSKVQNCMVWWILLSVLSVLSCWRMPLWTLTMTSLGTRLMLLRVQSAFTLI